jgi:gamma-glutamyl-gamma-aminobutyrate hydrolase PuuD
MRPKVFVVDNDVRVTRMFMANNWLVVPTAKEADLIQFTGGADVSPMLYGEPKHPRTYCDPNRDQHEANIFWHNYEKPKAGICRGGQFLNVMSGGAMWQDVDNHAIAGTHAALFRGDYEKEVQVTSTHHQMMREDFHGDVFLTARLSSRKEDGYQEKANIDKVPTDVEGVFYDMTESLCFQPHPEYVDVEHECQRLYFQVLWEYFGLTAEGNN